MERCGISIVMAVYNGERYLRETLDSIVAQTFTAFEAIIIDDASTDATPEILRDYAARDTRFRVFRNDENLRLARSLNRGISLAAGKYILRMDADDICLRDRLEKQYAYMERHPDTDVSFCKFFTLQNGEITPCAVGRACDADSIRAMFLFFCPVLHPGVIARADILGRYAYDPAHTCSEDLDLWTRMLCDGAKITCSGDYLLLYRLHDGQITATTTEKQRREVLESERAFYRATLAAMTDRQADFYIEGLYFRTRPDREQMLSFYRHIRAANRKTRQFRARAVVGAMEEVLAEYRRAGVFGLRDLPYLVRFGWLRLAAAVCRRKRQSRRDIAAAARAAGAAGLARRGTRGKLPVYAWGDANA